MPRHGCGWGCCVQGVRGQEQACCGAGRGVIWLFALFSVAFLAAAAPAQAQRFVQQWALGENLIGPQTLGLDSSAAPPDLDEPEVGEDPETAALAEDGDARPAAPKAHRRQKVAPPVHFYGQRIEQAPPLPLAAVLRRVLRDGPLGGGQDFWFTRRPARDVYFLSFDGGTRGRYLTLGSKHATAGDFSRPGWRFLSTLGIKLAAYEPKLDQRVSYVDLARLMPGYEARFGPLTLAAFAGLGYARSAVRGILATGRFGRYGLSAMGEFWYDWGGLAPALARFTSGYVMGETANRSFSVGLRHGVALPWRGLLAGPEAGWSAGRNVRAAGTNLHSSFRKGRLGAHLSEIPLFAARLRLSGGAEWHDRRRPGAYMEMTAYLAY